MVVTDINSTSEFDTLTGGDTPVIVDFYADWCGPCKIILPIFKKLSEQPDYQGVKFARVDTEAQQEVATKCGVRAMPTFILFQNGKNVGVTRGAVPAPLEALIKQAAALPQAPSTEAIETTPAPPSEATHPAPPPPSGATLPVS